MACGTDGASTAAPADHRSAGSGIERCGIRTDGTIDCRTCGSCPDDGDCQPVAALFPQLAPPNGRYVEMGVSNDDAACAIREGDHKLVCWGRFARQPL
jgi:hypothetical protein